MTRREQQIAIAISEGKSAKQIAHELGMAESTVCAHTGRIFLKTGVGSRAALTALVIRSGLNTTYQQLRATVDAYPFTAEQLRDMIALLLAKTPAAPLLPKVA